MEGSKAWWRRKTLRRSVAMGVLQRLSRRGFIALGPSPREYRRRSVACPTSRPDAFVMLLCDVVAGTSRLVAAPFGGPRG